MSELANPRFEAFARCRSSGMNASASYVRAYGRENPSQGAKMAKDPRILTRVAEIRGLPFPPVGLPDLPSPEPSRSVPKVPDMPILPPPVAPMPVLVPDANAAPNTLESLGYSKRYFAEAHRAILDRAIAMDRYSDASKALSKLQNMWDNEQVCSEQSDASPKSRIDIDALGDILDKVSQLVAISKGDHSPATPGCRNIGQRAIDSAHEQDE